MYRRGLSKLETNRRRYLSKKTAVGGPKHAGHNGRVENEVEEERKNFVLTLLKTDRLSSNYLRSHRVSADPSVRGSVCTTRSPHCLRQRRERASQNLVDQRQISSFFQEGQTQTTVYVHRRTDIALAHPDPRLLVICSRSFPRWSIRRLLVLG